MRLEYYDPEKTSAITQTARNIMKSLEDNFDLVEIKHMRERIRKLETILVIARAWVACENERSGSTPDTQKMSIECLAQIDALLKE